MVYVFCEKIVKNRLAGVRTAFRRCISKKMYDKIVSCASEITCDLYYFIRHAESSPKPATAHAVGAEQLLAKSAMLKITNQYCGQVHDSHSVYCGSIRARKVEAGVMAY